MNQASLREVFKSRWRQQPTTTASMFSHLRLGAAVLLLLCVIHFDGESRYRERVGLRLQVSCPGSTERDLHEAPLCRLPQSRQANCVS